MKNTNPGTQHIRPAYSDEEIFVLIELAFGAPPDPIATRYRTDPAFRDKVKAEADYYNDVTTLILSLKPDADIAWMWHVRKDFYMRHGIFSFEGVRSS